MLKIVSVGIGNIHAPMIICDHCGEYIRDGKDGNVLYNIDEETGEHDGIFYHTHKRCDMAYAKKNFVSCSSDLDTFMYQLQKNAGVDMASGKRKHKILGG